MPPIRLIVGLGNPGPQYRDTRHNVGAEFVAALGRRYRIPLVEESRFKGQVGRGTVTGHEVRLLLPSTYVNLSGDAVGALARFYKIEPPEILVAYDEMAFEPGVVRIKSGGGDNGHNGIRSVIAGLGSRRDFQRLRIGVGHPGDRSRVSAYLTSVRMPEDERRLLAEAYDLPEPVLRHLLGGDLEKAMTDLHSREAPGGAAQEED
ncbi:MAG: aminoacyl-tRNA hydrolase [Pseudomonadales bacterium]